MSNKQQSKHSSFCSSKNFQGGKTIFSKRRRQKVTFFRTNNGEKLLRIQLKFFKFSGTFNKSIHFSALKITHLYSLQVSKRKINFWNFFHLKKPRYCHSIIQQVNFKCFQRHYSKSLAENNFHHVFKYINPLLEPQACDRYHVLKILTVEMWKF